MQEFAKQCVDRCEKKKPDITLFAAYEGKGFTFAVTTTAHPIFTSILWIG